MLNSGKGLLGLISAGSGLLMKMLITLEPHHIDGFNFAYLYIFFCKLAGKMTIQKKYISHACIESLASGC